MVSPVKFEPLEGFYIKCAMLHKLKQTKMIKIYQIVVNKLATKFIFSNSEKTELITKIEKLQTEFPKSEITFITIEI